MGLLGRSIDEMPISAKDRIIVAQDWCSAGYTRNGARCLIGHADDWQPDTSKHGKRCLWEVTRFMECIRESTFDALVRRFGLQRIVRACKLRAGKPQPVLQEAPQHPILQSHNTPAEV